MAYREVYLYVVLCDHCGIVAPDGGTAGWWTPASADHAALEAGWAITATEHRCPVCRPIESQDGLAAADTVASGPRPALRPAQAAPRRDVCWTPTPPAHSQATWEKPR